MTKPIPDKAEVAIEYPDKLYVGTFERTARFDAHLDETGISLSLHRTGADNAQKSVHMHFHFALFAEMLRDLATTVTSLPAQELLHREELCDAARRPARGHGPNSGAGSAPSAHHGIVSILQDSPQLP